MDIIKKLMERVNNKKLPIEERYPELKITDEGKKNILFVSPMFNKQGLYRMILPTLELSETGKYNTIINQILPEDNQKIIDDYHIKLVPELIRWADYIVFSANGQNLDSVIIDIKERNPKVKVVMDMDRNYHALNPNNYTAKKFTVDKQRNLESNIRLVDFTTYPDFQTEDFYKKKIGLPIKTFILPNLLSPYQFDSIDKTIERPKDKAGKFRILLMADADDFDDINSFRDTINDIGVRVPEAKIYVLGNNLVYESKNPLRFIDYTKVPYDSLLDYYKIIWNMNPDLAIIPIKKQSFHRTYYKLLELGAFGIPIISMNEYPYNHLLTKDTHVLLSGQKKTFVSNVRAAIDSAEMREKLGKYAKNFISEKYIYNDEMRAAYLRAFN
jgi:hypothetical protein